MDERPPKPRRDEPGDDVRPGAGVPDAHGQAADDAGADEQASAGGARHRAREEWEATRQMWARGGLGWRELGRRLARQVREDDLLGRAAELSYFFFFSLFPLMLFFTTLLGYLVEGSEQLRSALFRYIAQLSPSQEVTELLRGTLREISSGRGGTKLWVGLLAAFWMASNGILAIGRTLNKACGLSEDRRWWKRRLVALALTLVCSVLSLSALVLILYGSEIGEALAGMVGLGDLFTRVWAIIQWPILLAFVIVAFELLYNFAPDLEAEHRVWLTPGAVVAVLLWVAVSWGFRLYLTYFGYYSRTYGSLGAVILLLLWVWMGGATILFGGEINSQVGAAARQTGER